MLTKKSFWLPKIPCIYGFFVAHLNFFMATYSMSNYSGYPLAYWIVTIPLATLYILMNIALVVYLCRFCDRGDDPLWFASMHWGLIFLSSLAALPWALAGVGSSWWFFIALFYFLTAPLYPFYALFPVAGPAAACVYAGVLAFFLLRGLFRKWREG